MSDVVIRVENLSKKYSIGQKAARSGDGLRHAITDTVTTAFRSLRTTLTTQSPANGNSTALNPKFRISDSSDFWALKDLSFEVKRGEVLGIIGRNGAGKSTLLKILSRITEPTMGCIGITGRVASLLEVGTGFHPELTGRENIYLNGAILGMSRAEIKRKFDEIVAFAEVERFLDTPVKRYSSGMYVRLAFSVAAHLEPDILIVDEVLAVGDVEFQNKCVGRMQDATTKEGRTVLFVSHNLAAVRTLCTKGILLCAGKIESCGPTETVLDAYFSGASSGNIEMVWDDPAFAPGDQVLRLCRVRVVVKAECLSYVTIEDDFFIAIEYESLQFHPRVCVSIHLVTQGVCAFVGGNQSTPHVAGRYRATVRIPGHLLNTSLYSVTVFLITDVTQYRAIVRDCLSFRVEEKEIRGEYVGEMAGVVRPRLEWTLDQCTVGAKSVPVEKNGAMPSFNGNGLQMDPPNAPLTEL